MTFGRPMYPIPAAIALDVAAFVLGFQIIEQLKHQPVRGGSSLERRGVEQES